MIRTPTQINIIIAILSTLLLVFFGKAAALGAAEGIELCLRSVIPALFPFFVISAWALPYFTMIKHSRKNVLSQYLHIPKGADSILLMGLLGGYPVGAQTITTQWKNHSITKEQAYHMLGFCNNAGPGFILGIAGVIFPQTWIPWMIWLIQVLSAILTGILIPYPSTANARTISPSPIMFTTALRKSLISIGSVCGWIILSKALLSMIKPLIRFPFLQVCIVGLVEISTGCMELIQLPSVATKFVLMNSFLSFGGLCVWMQTKSVTDALGTGLYFPGKLMQLIISIHLSIIAASILFRTFTVNPIMILTFLLLSFPIIWYLRGFCRKKMWQLSQS